MIVIFEFKSWMSLRLSQTISHTFYWIIIPCPCINFQNAKLLFEFVKIEQRGEHEKEFDYESMSV